MRALEQLQPEDLGFLERIQEGRPAENTRSAADSWDRLHAAGLLVTDGPTAAGIAALTAWRLAQ